jgi:peptide-methionine (S)-S-oxide reductase
MTQADDTPATQPTTQATQPAKTPLQTATFAAGCFWGVEQVFREVPGVATATVGYEGGSLPNPTYEDVCTDQTGHAEAVEVQFDPAKVTYDRLLDYFFANHDPTTVNRQGPDVGTQYRSVIFFNTPAQQAAAKAAVERWQKKFKRPIVTQIVPAATFWRAEEYHQQYAAKHGIVCHRFVDPDTLPK